MVFSNVLIAPMVFYNVSIVPNGVLSNVYVLITPNGVL